jgi:K(+)-stimulated pyrophosphate-energized sodium pump
MIYPLAIGAVCVITSIIGTFFVKLGANQSIMGALYKGFIATGVLSLIAHLPDHLLHARRHGHGAQDLGGVSFTSMDLFSAASSASIGHRPDHLDHRVLHRHGFRPVRSIARRRSPATAPT